jgi:peptidoglycan/LPS O-acetylase OafA/YrhL
MRGAAPAARPAIIADIEILRGVAICMVLVAHLPLNLLSWPDRRFRFASFWWQGAAGVDLFFTISGFVIGRSLLPRIAAARGAGANRHARLSVIWRFWLRRAFRLLPAAWLWLAIVLGLDAWLGRTSAFGDTHRNLHVAVAAVLNVVNLAVPWFSPAWPPPPTEIYWSLSLEEQFYVLLPLAALAVGAALPWLLAAALVYQYVVPLTLLGDVTRPGALAAGVLLSIAARQPWYAGLRPGFLARHAPLRAVFIIAGVAGLGVFGMDWSSTGLTLVALTAAALVFAASFDCGSVWPERRSGAVMAWIGSRSYAIYLAHMVCFRGTREIMGRLYGARPPHLAWIDALAIAAALAATLAAAELTYRLVEAPCRRFGRLLTSRPERAPAGAWEAA